MRRMGRIWTWREEAAGAFWDEARTVLKRNGVIAVPTETFFGLAVNPFQEEALAASLPSKTGPRKSRCCCWWMGQRCSIRWLGRSRVWPGGLWKNSGPAP